MIVALAAAPAAADRPNERVAQSTVAQFYLAGDASNVLLSKYRELRRQGALQAGTFPSATVRDAAAGYSVSLEVRGVQHARSVSAVRSTETVSKQRAIRNLVTGASTLSANETHAGIDALEYVRAHPSAQAQLTAADVQGDYLLHIVDRGRYVFVNVEYLVPFDGSGIDVCNPARMFRYDPATDTFAEIAYHCP